MISLKFKEFSLSAGQRHLFQDVSLHIDAGEAIAIVGESGIGKTSLAQAILR